MDQLFHLDGNLSIGKHKTISCNVQLEISSLDEAERLKPDFNIKEYVNGYRIMGEFSFDYSPLYGEENHPVKKNTTGYVILRDRTDSTFENSNETSKINILIVEKNGFSEIVPKKVRRYFWKFYVIGSPIWDKLDIFQRNYGVKMSRVFTCVNFRGSNLPVASVIVADNESEARIIFDSKLLQHKHENPDFFYEGYSLQEVNLYEKKAQILVDGEIYGLG